MGGHRGMASRVRGNRTGRSSRSQLRRYKNGYHRTVSGFQVENPPAKGDHHAREVFGLFDHGCRDGDGRQCRDFNVDRSASAQAAAGSVTTPAPAPALKTPGRTRSQGIWTDETQTSLQRPARYADQEFFTPEQRAELDNLRADILSRERRGQRGTEADVAGAYNSAFVTMKHIGRARR